MKRVEGEISVEIDENQVTQAYHFVADGWAGAYNPSPPSQTQTLHTITTAAFPIHAFTLIELIIVDERSDRRIDQMTGGPTDGQSLLRELKRQTSAVAPPKHLNC